jgi:hypothetical protein
VDIAGAKGHLSQALAELARVRDALGVLPDRLENARDLVGHVTASGLKFEGLDDVLHTLTRMVETQRDQAVVYDAVVARIKEVGG